MDTRAPAVSTTPVVLADLPTIQLRIAILHMPVLSSSRNTNEEASLLVRSPEGASEYQLTRKRRGEESANQDRVDQQPFKHRKKDSEGSIDGETDEEESEYSSEGETDLEERDHSSESDSEGLEDKARRYNEEGRVHSRDSSRLRQEFSEVQEENDAYRKEIIESKRRLILQESEISRWKLSCSEI